MIFEFGKLYTYSPVFFYNGTTEDQVKNNDGHRDLWDYHQSFLRTLRGSQSNLRSFSRGDNFIAAQLRALLWVPLYKPRQKLASRVYWIGRFLENSSCVVFILKYSPCTGQK